MTMHMIQGISSLNKKVSGPKMTKKNIEKWTEGCRLYNKDKVKSGEFRVSLEDYISIIHGKSKKLESASSGPSFECNFGPPPRRPNKHIPSYVGKEYLCSKNEPKKYTGTLVKGISTMHKSNAVPVIDEQEMIDHANMRR